MASSTPRTPPLVKNGPSLSFQRVAYYDDTEENLGMDGPRSESSVDIEAGRDGTLHVAYGVPGRYM